ncbi:MAG: hypothetical protein AB8B72_01030 [Crocinitomicaceae bacterium]
MMKKTISILMITILVAACGGPIDLVNKTVNNYSLGIPNYMTEMDLQNPEASFQAGEILKEHYVMVIDETKEDLLAAGLDYTVEDYGNASVDFLKQSLKDSKVLQSPNGVQKINGLEAISYKVTGKFPENDLAIFYYLTIYKSESNYYSMSTWTLGDRESKFTKVMEKMIQSFKEI